MFIGHTCLISTSKLCFSLTMTHACLLHAFESSAMKQLAVCDVKDKFRSCLSDYITAGSFSRSVWSRFQLDALG